MREILTVYSLDQINAVMRLILELLALILSCSFGVFTRELMFPHENTFRENIGFAIISGILVFSITVFYHNGLTLAVTFILSFGIGFFIPVFKTWLIGTKLFRVIARGIAKSKSTADSIMEEVRKELDKESED